MLICCLRNRLGARDHNQIIECKKLECFIAEMIFDFVTVSEKLENLSIQLLDTEAKVVGRLPDGTK